MNLALTDDQRMIRDAAQEFLAEASAMPAVRVALESEAGFDPAVWRRIGAELGWCGTAIPEEHNGLGLGPLELVLILEQMGRHLLCAPFFSTVCLAGNLLTLAGRTAAKKKYLPQLANGSLTATAAFAADLSAKVGKLSGSLRMSDASSAQLLLIATKDKVFAIAPGAKGVSLKPLKTWDGSRRFAEVRLKNVPAEAVHDPARRAGIHRAESLSQLYLAAEQLGGAQQCLDLIVRYTSERKQFGRSIASFQAVKHRCADLMVRIEALRSAVYGAAAFAAGTPAADALSAECAMAKSLASDTFFHAAQEAIQLHGGVGFTWEFEPHLHFKRAQVGSHWLGRSDQLREQIAQGLL